MNNENDDQTTETPVPSNEAAQLVEVQRLLNKETRKRLIIAGVILGAAVGLSIYVRRVTANTTTTITIAKDILDTAETVVETAL